MNEYKFRAVLGYSQIDILLPGPAHDLYFTRFAIWADHNIDI